MLSLRLSGRMLDAAASPMHAIIPQCRHFGSFNKAILLGIVSNDPVFFPFRTDSHPDIPAPSRSEDAPRRPGIWSFSVGTTSQIRDRTTGEWKSDTQWHRIKHFATDAEWKYAHKAVSRGSCVLVEGNIKYSKNQETERWYTDVIAEKVVVTKEHRDFDEPADSS